MRFSRLYDAEGGFSEQPANDEPSRLELLQSGAGSEPPAPNVGGSAAPPPSAAPSADPAPGPNANPAPQGGRPEPPQPPPPAVVSSVPGIKGSETTGGVQGSFAQAGSSEFSKRFGAPAAWFRGGPTAGLAREAGNSGRAVLGKERAGQVSGGYGAETVGNAPLGPSLGEEGGGKNDEEWQRLIQAVLKNRFQR